MIVVTANTWESKKSCQYAFAINKERRVVARYVSLSTGFIPKCKVIVYVRYILLVLLYVLSVKVYLVDLEHLLLIFIIHIQVRCVI